MIREKPAGYPAGFLRFQKRLKQGLTDLRCYPDTNGRFLPARQYSKGRGIYYPSNPVVRIYQAAAETG